MDTLLRDARHALRSLRKSAGFSLIAVFTLALGIGASTAMFTLVNSVLLRPIDYRDPDRLVMLWEHNPRGRVRNVVSPANFFAWREQATSFTGLSASYDQPQNLTGSGEPEEVLARLATDNFFEVLGAAAQIGRPFVRGDEDKDVVVLSSRLWQRRFGSDPAIVGRGITLNGRLLTVVGVMPASFPSVGGRPHLWLPERFPQDARGRYLQVVARLRPGATVEQARTEMSGLAGRLARVHPRNTNWGATVVPVHEQVTGDARPALLVLLGAVGLLLLIACVNVANLLLARAATRHTEIAVRLALGATRGRLVRQMLTESLLLAIVAGMFGLALAVWGTELLVRVLPADFALPRLDEVRVDGRVLGFALLMSLLTGVLFGTAPAMAASALNLAQATRDAMRGTTSGRNRLRRGLVVAEVALAVVLLVGAGLLGRSLERLLQVDTGVRAEHLLTMRVMMAGTQYTEDPALRNFMGALLPRLETLPGAGAAGAVAYLPLSGQKIGHSFYIDEQPRPRPGEEYSTDIRPIAGDYFRALGVPLLRGRFFDARDSERAGPVFIVNDALARQYFGGTNPVGKRISFEWGETISGEIVGVVGSVREMGPTEKAAPAIYRPYAQMPFAQMTVLLRAAGDPMALAAAAAAVVRDIDPNQPVAEIRTMEEVVANTVARPRLLVYLLGGFAGMALLLAALGLYGVISHSVTQRRHEIGVRVALGAAHRDVLRLIVQQGMGLTVVGLLVGLLAALAATRVMGSLLFETRASDPLTLSGVSAFLAMVALIACYVPARRATRVDPMVALRVE
jgi:putative ABC transport system permease protein